MRMIERELKNDKDTLVVWFDAWKYEKEEYLAVIPFLRTVDITLENSDDESDFKTRRWNEVRKGIKNTFDAFANSVNINLGFSNYASANINLEKFMDILKSKGSVTVDGKRIYYYEHPTEDPANTLLNLRKEKPDARIVVFIDDLDRCFPEKAMELLESIKTFFDIDGIIYVIGMDPKSINSIVDQKYKSSEGSNNVITGLDYMEKIVQLPFQIPTWQQIDISNAITKLISKGLKDTKLLDDFLENRNKNLIIKAIESNPRQVKRFVNTVILATMIYGKPIPELICVQALNFRQEWRAFLDYITIDAVRQEFFSRYNDITNKEKLDDLIKKLQYEKKILSKDVEAAFSELFNQTSQDLRLFLNSGAKEILENIQQMEPYRRALDTVKISPTPTKDVRVGHFDGLYSNLVLKWAPINYQFIRLDSENNNYNLKKDLVVPVYLQYYKSNNGVDLESRWDTQNIRERLRGVEIEQLVPVVYYAVAETESHYYILYSFYHADDDTHPSDMEGCLVLLEKLEMSELLLGIITVAHYDLWRYPYKGNYDTKWRNYLQ